jgi:hypothetical protein
MTDIKFSVHPHEDSEEVIECTCPVDDQLAVNLHCYTVNYGEPFKFLTPIFSDFCDKVAGLVYDHCGVKLPNDWIFCKGPEII